MKDGAWLVVSVLCGGGAFYGGMRIAEKPETKCVTDDQTEDARRATIAVAHASPPSPAPLPASTPMGRLFVSCSPSKNVTLLVDERPVGDVCPVELDVAVGTRRVEVRAPHYRPARATVTIEPSKTARLALTLEDEAGLFYRPHVEFPELRAQAVAPGLCRCCHGDTRLDFPWACDPSWRPTSRSMPRWTRSPSPSHAELLAPPKRRVMDCGEPGPNEFQASQDWLSLA